MLLEGIFPALTTPFHPDGRLHWHNLERNVERYSRTPVSGLVVLGSTGEAVMLSDQESRQVLERAREAAGPEKVLIAGVGRESLRETLVMAEAAAKAAYDVLLVRTPHFFRPQLRAAEMLNYYRMVADATELPVLLYSVPPYTAYDLPIAVVAELAHHPRILGMKDSSGDVARIAELVRVTRAAGKRTVVVTQTFTAVTSRMVTTGSEVAAFAGSLVPADVLGAGGATSSPAMLSALEASRTRTRTREVGFQILSGSAQTMLQSLNAGASGAVLAMAAFAPQACAEIHMAWKDKDTALADEKQARIHEAASIVVGRMGVPGVKYGCDLNGYYGGLPRLPLLPLSGEEKRNIEGLLADIRH